MAPKPTVKPAAKAAPTFRLPPTVAGPADISRLARELEGLDNYLRQADLRHDKDVQLPKLSRMLTDIAELNKKNLLVTADRQQLTAFMLVLTTKAPVLHISFSVDPSSAFTAKIVTWLRDHISPYVLVTIGRQPTIGGGCVVRTANKQFDFSFRQYLLANRQLLSDGLAKVAAK